MTKKDFTYHRSLGGITRGAGVFAVSPFGVLLLGAASVTLRRLKHCTTMNACSACQRNISHCLEDYATFRKQRVSSYRSVGMLVGVDSDNLLTRVADCKALVGSDEIE
jgi:hypothetical protein